MSPTEAGVADSDNDVDIDIDIENVGQDPPHQDEEQPRRHHHHHHHHDADEPDASGMWGTLPVSALHWVCKLLLTSEIIITTTEHVALHYLRQWIQ